MEIILLVVLVIAFAGFMLGYTKSAKRFRHAGARIFFGLLCAVGCVLLVAAIAFGACLCAVGGNLRFN